MSGRIEITRTIRVLHDPEHAAWCVWDDSAEDCSFWSTEEQAVAEARRLATEQAEDGWAEAPDALTLYERADRAAGEERRRLLREAAQRTVLTEAEGG